MNWNDITTTNTLVIAVFAAALPAAVMVVLAVLASAF